MRLIVYMGEIPHLSRRVRSKGLNFRTQQCVIASESTNIALNIDDSLTKHLTYVPLNFNATRPNSFTRSTSDLAAAFVSVRLRGRVGATFVLVLHLFELLSSSRFTRGGVSTNTSIHNL